MIIFQNVLNSVERFWVEKILPFCMKSVEFLINNFRLAVGPGLEPGLTESESVVLPLNYPPSIFWKI